MDKRAVALSEAAGCVVIYCAAVLLHYVYPLSKGAALSIVFGAVNESVWEHTKIFAAPYIGWALIQLCWLKVHFRQYVVAKVIGLYLMAGMIIGASYLLPVLTGKNIFWVDIAASLIAVITSQAASYRMETADNHLSEYFLPALMLLTLYYLMFFSFTIFPPKMDLFRDPISGGFGIVERIAEKERGYLILSSK